MLHHVKCANAGMVPFDHREGLCLRSIPLQRNDLSVYSQRYGDTRSRLALLLKFFLPVFFFLIQGSGNSRMCAGDLSAGSPVVYRRLRWSWRSCLLCACILHFVIPFCAAQTQKWRLLLPEDVPPFPTALSLHILPMLSSCLLQFFLLTVSFECAGLVCLSVCLFVVLQLFWSGSDNDHLCSDRTEEVFLFAPVTSQSCHDSR